MKLNTITTEVTQELSLAARTDGIDVSAYLPDMSKSLEVNVLKDEMRAYTVALKEYKISDLSGNAKAYKILGVYIRNQIAKFDEMNTKNKETPNSFKGFEFNEITLIKNLIMKERERIFSEIKSGIK